jgi:hypothetical protein
MKEANAKKLNQFVVLDAERSRVMGVIEARSESSGLAPALASMSEDLRTEVHYCTRLATSLGSLLASPIIRQPFPS